MHGQVRMHEPGGHKLSHDDRACSPERSSIVPDSGLPLPKTSPHQGCTQGSIHSGPS
jgi:hypothetical protein